MTHPNHDHAISVLGRLLSSGSRTDANVLIALWAGIVVRERNEIGVTRWRWDGKAAETAVGDEYAVSGRVRSQGQARARRRMVELELVEGAPHRTLRLTAFGRLVATKAHDEMFLTSEMTGARGTS